jgi:3-hydroxy acid dehydrogenase/malonic semialdehyde reductase
MSISDLVSATLKPRVRSLSGLQALVTGASSGIGLSTAVRLAQEGCHLHLVARRNERLEMLADEIVRINPTVSVKTYSLDLCSPSALDVLDAAGATDVDILINNAGLAKGLSTISDSNPSDWNEMLDINVRSVFELTRRTVQKMILRKSGDILAVSSIAAHSSYNNGAVYCATKHAIRAFHEALRLETLEHGLRVVMVSPGMVETEFSLVRFYGDHKKAQSVYKGVNALDAGDVAESILFALRQPRHINLDEIIIKPQQQGNPWTIFRNV